MTTAPTRGPWTRPEDPERVYAVAYEGIGGVEAKLVIPTGDSGGYTGIYFENLGGQSFNLVGEDLTPEQQQTAFAIFRSIRSLGQSGSTKDPDEVTLEGAGCYQTRLGSRSPHQWCS